MPIETGYATAGFTYLPGMAGTPTGTPTAYTGPVPLVVDTAASKLWAYIGSNQLKPFSDLHRN